MFKNHNAVIWPLLKTVQRRPLSAKYEYIVFYAMLMTSFFFTGYTENTWAGSHVQTYALENNAIVNPHKVYLSAKSNLTHQNAQSKMAIYPLVSFSAGILKPSQFKVSEFRPQFYEYRYVPLHNEHHLSFLGIGGGIEMHSITVPRLKSALLLNYYDSTPYSVHGNVIQGVDDLSAEIYHYHYRVHTQQVLIEGRFTYQIARLLQPYAQLGIGISRITSNNFEVNVSNFLEFSPQYSDFAQQNLSYSLGAGLNFDLSDHLSMSFGYQISSLGSSKLGTGVVDGEPIHFRMKQSNYEWRMFIAQLSWRFNP